MGYVAVTTPRVVTVCPTSGLAAPVPWISAIGTTSPGSGPGPPPSSPLFCGVTALESVRSLLLSSVSAYPVRLIEAGTLLADGAGPTAVSNVFEVPYPMRSTTFAAPAAFPAGSVTGEVDRTSARVPVVPDGLRPPVASGVGSAAPFEPFDPPCTR